MNGSPLQFPACLAATLEGTRYARLVQAYGRIEVPPTVVRHRARDPWRDHYIALTDADARELVAAVSAFMRRANTDATRRVTVGILHTRAVLWISMPTRKILKVPAKTRVGAHPYVGRHDARSFLYGRVEQHTTWDGMLASYRAYIRSLQSANTLTDDEVLRLTVERALREEE